MLRHKVILCCHTHPSEQAASFIKQRHCLLSVAAVNSILFQLLNYPPPLLHFFPHIPFDEIIFFPHCLTTHHPSCISLPTFPLMKSLFFLLLQCLITHHTSCISLLTFSLMKSHLFSLLNHPPHLQHLYPYIPFRWNRIFFPHCLITHHPSCIPLPYIPFWWNCIFFPHCLITHHPSCIPLPYIPFWWTCIFFPIA